MNPSEQQDFYDVFGPKNAAKVAGFTKGPPEATISDRYAENWARRKGSPLPDTRKGKRPTGSKFAIPLNPLEGGDDIRRSLDGTQPSARDRYREPVLGEPSAIRMVRAASGKSQRTKVALTKEEHDERLAKLDAKNDLALATALAEKELEQNVPRRVVLPAEVPKRLQDVADKTRLYALKAHLGQREKLPDIKPPERCPRCDEYRCECLNKVALEIEFKYADEVVDPRQESWLDSEWWDIDTDPAEDRPQWLVDHATEIAEDELSEAEAEARYLNARYDRREQVSRELDPWIEWVIESTASGQGHLPPIRDLQIVTLAWNARRDYADLGIFDPPDEPFEYEAYRPIAARCVHCHVDPIQTKRDGLCRNCKTYKKKNGGSLPSQKVIDSRKRKRGLA